MIETMVLWAAVTKQVVLSFLFSGYTQIWVFILILFLIVFYFMIIVYYRSMYIKKYDDDDDDDGSSSLQAQKLNLILFGFCR